jgi:hypothetical protein
MGAKGTAVLDFTSTYSEEASVVVPVASILSGSHVEAFFMLESTAGNTVDDHDQAAVLCQLVCGNIVAGTSFTIYGRLKEGLAKDTFNVRWVWD